MGLDAGDLPLWHRVLKYCLSWGARGNSSLHCPLLSPCSEACQIVNHSPPPRRPQQIPMDRKGYIMGILVWFFVCCLFFFLISTNFLSSTEFRYLDLVMHLIQISVTTLTSPTHNTQHHLLERENGKYCIFIPSSKPE